MIIVKLGGSIITDKNKYKTFRLNETENIIKQLININDDFIIVHGGGSFGHIMAKKYKLPGKLSEKSLNGYTIVHNDMLELSIKISNLLLKYNINNIGIPVSSIIYNNKKNYNIFKKYFSMNIMPLSYGDVYLKNQNCLGIYSGDNIVYDLSRIFKPEKVIFISDVDGIYDKNPKKYSNAKLLKIVNKNNNFKSDNNDVTGGIMGKYKIMKKISKLGIKTYLINGFYPQRLNLIDNNEFIGTVVWSNAGD